MRSLGLALFAEGPTDERFFPPLLQRVAVAICQQDAREEVEVGPVIPLLVPEAHRDRPPAHRVLDAAREAQGEFDILFLHADGAGDPDGARRLHVLPATELIRDQLNRPRKETVAVVPVREMEAWALVDGEALRAALGISLSDEALGLPENPREVERIFDPKLALDQACARVAGPRRGRRTTAATYLDAIALRIQLARIRRVPAFQRFERDLRIALRDLGYLPR